MSTRIVRAPVRTQQTNGPQEGAKGTAPSGAANPTQSTSSTQTTPLQGRFETHTGHDPLLNQGQTKQVKSPRVSVQRAVTAESQKGEGEKEKAKGGGRTRGKRALALLGGSQTMKVDAKTKAQSKAKTKAEAKSKTKAQSKKATTTKTKGSKAKAVKTQTRSTGLTGSAAKKGKKVAAQGQETKGSTQASGQGTALTAKGKAATTQGTSPTGAEQTTAPSEGKGTLGTSQALQPETSTQATGSTGNASSMTGSGPTQATGEAGPTGQTAIPLSSGKAETAQATAGALLTGATGGKEAATTLGKGLAEGAEAADSGKAGAGKTAKAKESFSLKSLMFQGAKETGETGRTESREEADSPRQQFRQLVKQWTNAVETNIMQSLQAAMPNDVAAIAWKLASLAQSGVLPKGELMSMISKILKKPGGKKQIDRIKALLVKKGMVAAGVSSDTLALIAAMVAMYLGKQGNIDADDLIEELFGTPSRGLDFVLPEGGGSFHEEGREQQAHDEHASGLKLIKE